LFNQGDDGQRYVAIKQYLYDDNGETRLTKMLSIIEGIYTQHGSRKIEELLGATKIFLYPKPSALIKKIVQIGMDKDDIILDFFSGSATTAYAVMQLNAEDGGNRKFICVQLPKLCDEKSEAYKAGYKNICEIGKERIRRAGAKILAEVEEANRQIKIGEEEKSLPDVGFKVFKLDTSNIKLWDGTPVAEEDIQILLERMNDMIDSIKDDHTDMDVVYYEIMLKMGVLLTYPVQIHPFHNRKLFIT